MTIPLTDEEYEKIYIKQELITKIEPPKQAGEVLGNIYAYIGDEKIYEKEIYLEENISKKKVKEYFIEGIKNMFKPIGLTL